MSHLWLPALARAFYSLINKLFNCKTVGICLLAKLQTFISENALKIGLFLCGMETAFILIAISYNLWYYLLIMVKIVKTEPSNTHFFNNFGLNILYPPPPPPHSLGSQNTPLQAYISLLFSIYFSIICFHSIISVKTPSVFGTVFYTHQNVKEF